MHSVDAPWVVAVFSSRESVSQLLKTVLSCRAACGAHSAVIDVVINGNAGLATEFSKNLGDGTLGKNAGAAIRVWHITLGDKSHAWNTYIHEIWPSGSVTFFVDGYVEVYENSFEKLAAALATHSHARAATGTDVMGRSADRQAKFQIEISGIHGNLYALSREAVLQVRESGFRLPLGLYRTDPTLESCLKWDFDPSANAWNKHRITVVTDVTWKRPVSSPWRFADWIVHWRRMIRQAQGDVEQQALKTFFANDKKRPRELPETAEELLRQWIDRFPSQWRRMVRTNPLRLLAIRRACRPRDWTQVGIPPTLISTF
jgi:hypothetical protein